MAGEVINATIGQGFLLDINSTLAEVFSPLMGIFKAVGIAIIIYIVFLIVKAIIGIKNNFILRKIGKNVEEINTKIDLLVKKKKH